ncbi:peptidase G1 [Boletus reticuloceps]|uniref:Peptidase G1 n=1 Tax=Boletus reticuloceps TaxID=495285 RepID=A0A8I3A8E8_9AGAM|nr:peptidase G1 [Boletus reticuloceps]
MRFIPVLISSFFASAVLAAPGRERRDTLPDSFWAGNILTLDSKSNGTIQYVTSTIHAPDITGQTVGSYAVAFVGIDGAGSCSSALRLGLVFNLTTEGPSYTVIYQHDIAMGPIDGVHIATGDPIEFTVNAPIGANMKLGIVTVKNLNNNQSATQKFNLTERLCGKTAEWVVENLTDDSTSLAVNSMLNFGTLTFANAEIGGNDLGQLDSNIVNIIENGLVLTSVSADSDSVSVMWL